MFYAIYMATRPRACIFHKTLGLMPVHSVSCYIYYILHVQEKQLYSSISLTIKCIVNKVKGEFSSPAVQHPSQLSHKDYYLGVVYYNNYASYKR